MTSFRLEFSLSDRIYLFAQIGFFCGCRTWVNGDKKYCVREWAGSGNRLVLARWVRMLGREV